MYWDDQLLCLQARQQGFSTVFSGGAVVYHRWGANSDGRFPSYYGARNKIFVANAALHFPWKLLFHVTNILIGAARIVRATLRGRLRVSGALLSGMVDGYRGVTGKWKHHDGSPTCKPTL